MVSDAGYIPEKEGVSRIRHMTGLWQFRQVGENRVEVTYTLFSGQRSAFPRWITDPIIQGNMIKTMKNFRTLGEEKYLSEKVYTKS